MRRSPRNLSGDAIGTTDHERRFLSAVDLPFFNIACKLMRSSMVANYIQQADNRGWIQLGDDSLPFSFLAAAILDLDDLAFCKMRKTLQVIFLQRLVIPVAGFADPEKAKLHKR